MEEAPIEIWIKHKSLKRVIRAYQEEYERLSHIKTMRADLEMIVCNYEIDTFTKDIKELEDKYPDLIEEK